MNKKTIILLDTLALLHRSYYAIPDLANSQGVKTGALYGTGITLFNLIKTYKPHDIIACFDLPEKTFRHEANKTYKANREAPDEDLISQIELAYKLFSALGIPVFEKAGFEADDIIGTLADKFKENFNVIIATGDQDLFQLVDDDKVSIFYLKRGVKDTALMNEKSIKQKFGFPPELIVDYKGLRGDTADNIKGVAGIGDVGAKKLVGEYGTLESIYEALGNGELVKDKIQNRLINALENGREDAFSSRQLTTINRNVSISVSPHKTAWESRVNFSDLEMMLKYLEFRKLLTNFSNLLGIDDNNVVEDGQGNGRDLLEAKILLWIIDSDKTNPSKTDILSISDTKDLVSAKKKLLQKVDDMKLTFIWKNIEEPLIDVLDRMEKRGILLDIEYIEKLAKKYEKALEIVEDNIFHEAKEKFNPNSPKQLSEILFKKLELGKKSTSDKVRSTKESELQKIKDEHKIVPYILEQRHLSKLITTYLKPLPKVVSEKDKRIHTNFIQYGTATGRMACRNPNLQNIPKRSVDGRDIRKAFIAEKGYRIFSFDYSQMELRLSAILSKDPGLISIFGSNQDIHTQVAEKMFNVTEDNVTIEQRARAKAINFGILYGMGATALSKGLEISLLEAKKYLANHREAFPVLYQYLEHIKKTTRKTGYTETLFSRRRYIHDINSNIPFIKVKAERVAVNSVIQGTAADIIKLAMIKLDKLFSDRDDVRMLVQVHDELLFEIRDDVPGDIIETIKKEMTNGFLKDSPIPLVVDCSKGDSWGDLS